ncbi:hypothetical protein [Delftia lacustris]|jgi:hypothetical protein|uniref:hypothetical protein n=1 Tax=Delftia lacustris TaxID=558537 RepID=UPI0028598D38|nr:hypothetical protein [Delftia lacustris]MDR6730286.1 hypothetical protein [Delftia lacustris]
MAERKLRTDRRTAISYCCTAISSSLIGCAHREPGIGLSLEFYNKGSHPLATRRFDFDGKRGPIPGYLGPSLTNSKNMGFMPGDIKSGVPKFVEAEWVLHSEEFLAWSNNTPDNERYSKENREIYRKLWAANPHYVQRIELTPMLTPELIAKVQADRSNTQLKMIVIFRDDKVEITAKPYKWR